MQPYHGMHINTYFLVFDNSNVLVSNINSVPWLFKVSVKVHSKRALLMGVTSDYSRSLIWTLTTNGGQAVALVSQVFAN